SEIDRWCFFSLNQFIFYPQISLKSQLLNTLKIDMFDGCKSNKDRTSIFEVMMQTMLIQDHASKNGYNLKQNELVPENFMVQAGHIKIQELNTAIPGYRIDKTTGESMDKNIYKALIRNSLSIGW
ncbi:hypothetical protein, partial [uncultured Endozoicomonas sp.]|uniref:hypothetical protein n=1 Tax=uncultured Endozoicomonas sp. TaxID=432652 RepID=UPI00262C7B19